MKFIYGLILAGFVAINPASATVIAWDGHILAADSQTTEGAGRKHYWSHKIRHIDHYYVGAAGDLNVIQAFFRTWGKEGREAAEKKAIELSKAGSIMDDRTIALIIVDEKTKNMELWSSDGEAGQAVQDYGAPYAIGSGSGPAIASMKSGKDAAEAVEITEEIDVYVGGPVQYVDLDEKLPTLRTTKHYEKPTEAPAPGYKIITVPCATGTATGNNQSNSSSK